MTRGNFLTRTQQFKIPLIFLSVLLKYAVMLIIQKWNVELCIITVYNATYFAPHPLCIFMCCHLCKPIKLSLKINIRKLNFN